MKYDGYSRGGWRSAAAHQSVREMRFLVQSRRAKDSREEKKSWLVEGGKVVGLLLGEERRGRQQDVRAGLLILGGS